MHWKLELEGTTACWYWILYMDTSKSMIITQGNSSKALYRLTVKQRLTTLFLLHWFIAVKEEHQEEAVDICSKFTYEHGTVQGFSVLSW